MNITSLNDIKAAELKKFNDAEWKKADYEHYGKALPDFGVLNHTFIAEELGIIIGQIEIKINQGVAQIESLLVGSEYQGKGVGRQLVQEAEKWMIQNGAHKVTLETGLYWSAKIFYEKLGYEVRVILPNDVSHQDFVLMDKMLGSR